MNNNKQFPVSRTAFSVAEVAGITGLSTRQLMKEQALGRLHFVNFDGRLIVFHMELRRYLNEYRQREDNNAQDAAQMVLFDTDKE